MSNPIRIGVIGCGRILPAHFRGLMRLREAGYDGFRVTGLVARNPDDARRFRKRGEGPAPRPPVARDPNDSLAAPHSYVSDWQPEQDAQIFDSIEAILAADAVDAVTITASLPVHHTATLQALSAGKHVMVEKPLAVSVRAGRQMVDAADANGLTLGVMEMVRYQPATRMNHWLIERGDLGDVQMVVAVSIGTSEWSPDRVVADTPWRHDRLTAGGGASIDIGVHLSHRLRYLVGEVETMTAVARVFDPVRTVRDADGNVFGTVRADADDAFFAIPEFAGSATGTISFTWAGHGEPTGLPGGLTIYGTRGCLKGTTLIRDDGSREDVADIFAREASEADRERYFPRGVTDAFGLTYLDWLNAIASGSHPETSGADALRDLATAFSIMESATARRPIAVNDVLSGEVNAYQREIDEH
ncbi:MAG TPA: Gfo/Idh/MocA family oxidoreductase, partial [Thermomicrobiales bacterium]|nr:Gfo/Idh/MocA family oxidoreductase [Thermomicrobiales bacterium]